MSYFPRRLSKRGPGRVSYDPSEPMPPEPASDEERERVLDERWRYYDMLDAQAAGDCEPQDPERYAGVFAMLARQQERMDAIDREGYSPDRDDAGLRSDEREGIVAGTDE